MATKSAKTNNEVEVVEKEDTRAAEDKFNEEAAKVPVPTSISMNSFRQQINDAITNSQLHPECILEVLRSAVSMTEHMASEVANAEMSQYRQQIQDLQTKYKLN